MTKRGKLFVQLVYKLDQENDPNEQKKLIKRIMRMLLVLGRGHLDPNDLINATGFMRNCAKCGDTKVIICKSLAMRANYDMMKGSIYRYDKQYYEANIINTLLQVVDGISLEEAYGRLGDFITF